MPSIHKIKITRGRYFSKLFAIKKDRTVEKWGGRLTKMNVLVVKDKVGNDDIVIDGERESERSLISISSCSM